MLPYYMMRWYSRNFFCRCHYTYVFIADWIIIVTAVGLSLQVIIGLLQFRIKWILYKCKFGKIITKLFRLQQNLYNKMFKFTTKLFTVQQNLLNKMFKFTTKLFTVQQNLLNKMFTFTTKLFRVQQNLLNKMFKFTTKLFSVHQNLYNLMSKFTTYVILAKYIISGIAFFSWLNIVVSVFYLIVD